MAIPAFIRVHSYRTLRQIEVDFRRPGRMERRAKVFWGATGTGKSRRAWDEAGDLAYSKCPRSKFWDGYAGEKNVIVDEFRGGIDISHVLRWLDRYPVRVDVKHGSRPHNADSFWFTSNIEPRYWYPEICVATRDALFRRLEIFEFREDGSILPPLEELVLSQ